MDEVILDIETDGLLDTVTKVHLIVYRNISTGNLVIAENKEDIKIALEDLKDKKIIGHNILGFDLIEFLIISYHKPLEV